MRGPDVATLTGGTAGDASGGGVVSRCGGVGSGATVGVGATVPACLALLCVFWLALTSGRVAASRLPRALGRLSALAGVSAASILGCLFLLNTSETSGAFMGAVLAGGGLGALHPLTMAAVSRRGHRPAAFVPGFFVTTFLGGILLAGLIGPLTARYGVDVVVWVSLAGTIAAMLVATVIAIESKLSEAAAAR